MIKPAKKITLATKLGKLLQKEPRGHSELLSSFFSNEGDPLDDIATNFDLDTIRKKDILTTRHEMYEASQVSLAHRGLPDVLTVYRYGDIRGGDVTSVTLDANVAKRGAKTGARFGPTSLNTYKINRTDVLCDVDAIFWGQVFLEEELLVRPTDLQPLDSQMFEMFIQDVIESILNEVM